MKEKAITLPGRVTLQYVEQGDPGGLPVIFLHGVTDSWRSFELMLPHLPPSIHAFALTQRGHGDSERPMEGYRTRDFAGDVAAFADALDLGAIVVVGHSMGSTNAMGFASEYPQRTLGLVLAAAFFRYRLNAVIEEFTSEVLRLTDPIAPAFARDFQLGTLARPIPGWFLDQAGRESLSSPW
jgi:pimeloyl-ACP methyl ester carboxylesterase